MKRLISVVLIALLIPAPIAEAKPPKSPKIIKSKQVISCTYRNCKHDFKFH